MESKLAELIIYISQKSEKDTTFGLTKLNKILFASDFFNFGYHGKAITGEPYVHRQKGPTPKYMKDALSNLETSGRAKVITVSYYGYPQKRVMPSSGADLSKFSEEEIELIDSIIDEFKSYNGTDLSDWTHKQMPWLVTDNEQDIPYESVFVLRDMPVERAAIVWAQNELVNLRKEKAYAY